MAFTRDKEQAEQAGSKGPINGPGMCAPRRTSSNLSKRGPRRTSGGRGTLATNRISSVHGKWVVKRAPLGTSNGQGKMGPFVVLPIMPAKPWQANQRAPLSTCR